MRGRGAATPGQLLAQGGGVVGEAFSGVAPGKGFEPLPRTQTADLFRAHIPGKSGESAGIAVHYGVARMRPPSVAEKPCIAGQRFDRLAVGRHYDAERSEVDGQNSHSAKVPSVNRLRCCRWRGALREEPGTKDRDWVPSDEAARGRLPRAERALAERVGQCRTSLGLATSS